ncbi:MAG: hypothetical protein E6Q24_17500 [Chitinophagaceae bacterium]|nr:MAG: hypothetical protein E6Q24_17500 [Chitinophagaceae bacterium]
MVKDKRYTNVKNLISGGHIKNFKDLFDVIPKTVVAHDLGINNVRFTELMEDVGRYFVKDLFKLAELIEVPEIEVMKLICNQYSTDKKAKRKR